MLPEDPLILLSYVNTMLRDECDSLEELCRKLDVEEEWLTNKLASVNYRYNKNLNSFK